MRSVASLVTLIGVAVAVPSLAQVRAPLPQPPRAVATVHPTTVPLAAGTILPGEFAIRHFSKKYVSLSRGVLSLSPTLGPNERLRIVQAARGKNAIQGPDGTIITASERDYMAADNMWVYGDVAATLPTSSPAVGAEWAIVAGKGPSSVSDGAIFLTTNPLKYMTVEGSDWSHFYLTTTSNTAHENFRITKCGDIGSGHRYTIAPVGLKKGPFPAWAPLSPPRLMRGPDGSYEFQFIENATPTHFLTVTGAGGFANDQDAPEGHVLQYNRTAAHEWEKFRIVDQGDCTYAIQTPKGFFLGWKLQDSGFVIHTSRVSDVKAAPQAGYTALVELLPDL